MGPSAQCTGYGKGPVREEENSLEASTRQHEAPSLFEHKRLPPTLGRERQKINCQLPGSPLVIDRVSFPLSFGSLQTSLFYLPTMSQAPWMICNYHTPCVCVCELLSRVRLSATPWTIQPARLLCPWNSTGKNIGVDCHSLLHVPLVGFYQLAHIRKEKRGKSKRMYSDGVEELQLGALDKVANPGWPQLASLLSFVQYQGPS